MSKGTVLFIHSYFDSVKLRNHLRKETIDFVQINKCSKEKSIDLHKCWDNISGSSLVGSLTAPKMNIVHNV